MSKLQDLKDQTGMNDDELMEQALYDGVDEGICKNPGCNFTMRIEPDSDSGWCEDCNTNSVVSFTMMMGCI